MNRCRAAGAGLGLAVLTMLAAACTREVASPQLPTTSSTAGTGTTVLPTTTGATTTAPPAPTTSVAETSTSSSTSSSTSTTTTEPASSDIVGVAVAGSAGGIGVDQTDGFSEVVRNEDGTCSGWLGRDVTPPWTDGLVTGAPFFILARESGTILGEGVIGASSFENVATDGGEQWVCTFPFEATIDGAPQEFMIKVADLDPWLVRPDPLEPGRFVSSVNTIASAERIPECASPPAVATVAAWDAVGQYWSTGLRSLCASGLTVADIERPCRGGNEGSDYIVKVVSAADPDVVYEDYSGVLVDPATLPPGTPVVVLIATGRPCG